MPKAIVWKGSKNIHLQPGFPVFHSRGDSETWRFHYRGPLRSLMAARPIRGSQIAGYKGYFVEEVIVEPDGAGVDGPGTMRVTAGSVVIGGTSTPEDQTKVSIESGRLEKSIYQNPYYKDIPEKELARIRKAFESGDPIPIFDDIGATWISAAYRLYESLNKGEQSYIESAPVVRIVSFSASRPAALRTGRGTRMTEKPHPAAPDGYEWLRTVSDINQDGGRGKWQHVVMWEAADTWNPLHYDIPE